jgi:hypothetical protein
VTAADFSCSGQRIILARLRVPRVGAWLVDVDFELDPDVSGPVVVRLGELDLAGTVDPARAGTHGGQRRVRVAAGAGAWGVRLPKRAYHTDAGVFARTVAADAAREAGEDLDAAALPTVQRLGRDYVRTRGPASRALEDAIGADLWWVGYDGVTRIGARAETEAEIGTYEVLDFDPRQRVVSGAVDSLSAIGIGSILVDRLDEPQTVRELEFEAAPGGIRFKAWTGGSSTSRNRAGDALRTVVSRLTDRTVVGLVRYRVVRTSADRLELQVVNRDFDAPDILPISTWPGVAGAHAEPTPGAEVLVQFIEGSRELPVVTHFAGKDGTGWSPVNLTIDASAFIKLGKDAEALAARADYTDARIETLQQAHDSHDHPASTTATVGLAGPATVTVLATLSPVGPLESVAATKVKVE